ncbi:MAG: hypothetical protein FJ267_07530, partial [Planctomycetes bacterium]|nr:hypothetical protein [Planctomycetota bacterium]
MVQKRGADTIAESAPRVLCTKVPVPIFEPCQELDWEGSPCCTSLGSKNHVHVHSEFESEFMLAFLQLVRLPTVFTAMADIFLGYALTHRYIVGPPPEGWDNPSKFFGLLIASCCLYLSGMVFNDVFDRKQDAIERPSRPIPSGRVSLRTAILLGVILMAVGVVSAAT